MFKTLNKCYIIIALFFIKLFGVYFSVFIFNQYSPLVDAAFYFKFFYINATEIRTQIVQHIVILLNEFNEIVIHYFCMFLNDWLFLCAFEI